MSAVIETNRLTKCFRNERTAAVRELSVTVSAGEVFGFLGPNGAGKTTTIRMLLDFLRPTYGSATVFGFDARGSSTEIHRRVGYLPGDLSLYERLTGSELLKYFARLKGGANWRYIDELSDRLELPLDQPIHSLSRGNRQKVGLVQACMSEPELLVLDEPTSGLDPLKQKEFQRIVREIAAQGRTVFLSFHALTEVEQTADRVAIIREGGLVLVEEIEKLKQRAIHRVETVFSGSPPLDEIEELSEVSNLVVDGHLVEFSVTGSFDRLIKLLARFEVSSFISREADLEEIFLSYYRGEGGAL